MRLNAPMIHLALINLSTVLCMHRNPSCTGKVKLAIESTRCPNSCNTGTTIDYISTKCSTCRKINNELATICQICFSYPRPDRSWHTQNCDLYSKVHISITSEPINCSRCQGRWQKYREHHSVQCLGCNQVHPSYSTSHDLLCSCTWEMAD
jgi:hypothetical protein